MLVFGYFSLVFMFIAFFFVCDVASGFQFYDFVELGVMVMLSLFSFIVLYVTFSNKLVWSVVSVWGNSVVNFYIGSLEVVSFHSFTVMSSSNVFLMSVFSFYHLYFVSFNFCYSFAVSSLFSSNFFNSFTFLFGFINSDGFDFLYASCRSSSLWLFCVLLFCTFSLWVLFFPLYSNSSILSVSMLSNQLLLEISAFVTVVFYVIGLFMFCLLGLVVWYSLYMDVFGVLREVYAAQWFWGEVLFSWSDEWNSASLVGVYDLFSDQLRLLTTVSPFLFDLNVLYCLNLSSIDVIHSFGLPKFGLKVDVMPGTVTHAYFVGLFSSLVSVICSELCGAKHSQMYAEFVFG